MSMNGHRFVLRLRRMPEYVVAYFVILFVQVFNMNETSAAIRFTLYPTLFAIALCVLGLLTRRSIRTSKNADYVFLALMVVGVVISTRMSSVVSWSAVATGFMIFVGLYYLITLFHVSAVDTRAIMIYYSVLVIVISLWTLANFFLKNDLLDNRASISFFGVVKDQNYLSAFMVPSYTYLLASFFWGKKRKKSLIVFAVLIFFACYITGSRAAFLTMLIASALIFSKVVLSNGLNAKSILILFAIVIAMTILYLVLRNTALFARMGDVEGYTDNIRLKIWAEAMKAYYANPIWGSGIQSGTYYAQQELRWYTHNCFIDMLTGQGLIGTILFLLTYIYYFWGKKGNRLFMFAMLVSYLIPLFFINGYETLTFWVPMCMCKLLSDAFKEYSYKDILWEAMSLER